MNCFLPLNLGSFIYKMQSIKVTLTTQSCLEGAGVEGWGGSTQVPVFSMELKALGS